MMIGSFRSPKVRFSRSDIRSGVAAVTCSFIYGLLMGTPALSSLFFVASMARFNIDRERASFPFLLCYTTKNVFGPVIGFLGNKFGLKKIILFGSFFSSVAVGTCFFAEDIVTIIILWGVVFGLSFGLGVALLPQVLGMHFSKHLDKAVGINVGGECVGLFLLTFLTNYLLKSYGISGTFLILSGVILHSVPAAMLISIPNKVEKFNPITENVKLDSYKEVLPRIEQLELELRQNEFKEQKMTVTSPVPVKENLAGKSPSSVFKVLLDPTYILILITQSAFLYISTTIGILLFDVSIDHSVSETNAVYILVSFQVADAVGRFTLGFVTDYGCLSKANFSGTCFAAVSLMLISLIWMKGFAAMMTFVLVTGFFQGGLMLMSPSIVMHYMDKDFHSIAIASRYLLYPPVSFTQAPLIGYFRDTLRSYDGLIFILAGIYCMSSVVSFLIPPFVRFRESRKKHLQDRENQEDMG